MTVPCREEVTDPPERKGASPGARCQDVLPRRCGGRPVPRIAPRGWPLRPTKLSSENQSIVITTCQVKHGKRLGKTFRRGPAVQFWRLWQQGEPTASPECL